MPPSTSAGGKEEPFPYATMLVLQLINFSESLQGNIVWPFISEAVQRWGCDPQETGFYVGIMASAFFFAQLCFVVSWGRAADKYGRRPILLLGLVGTGTTMLMFGFVRSYWVAVGNRFLTGALSANTSTSKVVAGEISPRSQLTKAFTLLSTTWALGTIIAPALGGWLASPADQYPGSALDIPLFREYPYLLPSLISSVWSWLALLLGFFCLPETPIFLQKKRLREELAARSGNKESKPMSERQRQAELELTPLKDVSSPSDYDDGEANDIDGDAGDLEKDGASEHENAPMLATTEETEKGAFDSLATAVASSPATSVGVAANFGGSTGKKKKNARVRFAQNLEASADGNAGNDSSADTPGRAKTKEAGHFSAPNGGGDKDSDQQPILTLETEEAASSVSRGWKDKAIRYCLLAYALLSWGIIVYDELVPVCLRMPVKDGGLGFPTNLIGSVQIISGVAHLAAQLVLFPLLNRRFGLLRSFQMGMLPLLVLALFPLVGRAAGDAALSWSVLGFFSVVKTASSSVAFTAIILMINNSARGIAVGVVTGLSQAVASFVRTLGPALGGGLFTASLMLEGLGVWRLHLVYVLIALSCLFGYFASLGVPSWCNEGPDYSKLTTQVHAQSQAQAQAPQQLQPPQEDGEPSSEERREDNEAEEGEIRMLKEEAKEDQEEAEAEAGFEATVESMEV